MSLPRFMIAAPASGSGKTLITCGLLQALVDRGLRVASFKCGPDYIDPMFHSRVIGARSKNLDAYFVDAPTLRYMFGRTAGQCDVSVVEGVMGFYDGVDFTGTDASSYDVSEKLDIPVILIVNSRGASLSTLAVLKGFKDFRPNRITGVIFNQMSQKVYDALVDASQAINGHWDAFVVADLPLVSGSSAVGQAEVDEAQVGATAVDTIEKAIAWKKSNAFDNERSKVYWPQGIDNLGNVYHLSTLAVVELMRADFSHNSVPMETCGNKAIPIIKQYFGANATNRGFSQQEGKELTQNGISTAVAWGGEWVLWGDHTAAYTYGADVDPRAIFDVSMRMLMHITNDFQREWSPRIDEPMTRALKDEIINREQEKLDGYVSMGALLGEPQIVFLESENSTTDIMNGDFRWDIAVTPTPPLKSASVYVAYTDAGFSVYYEGGDE